jgi:hypothetical protein
MEETRIQMKEGGKETKERKKCARNEDSKKVTPL